MLKFKFPTSGNSVVLAATALAALSGCRAQTAMPGIGNSDVDMTKPATQLPVADPTRPANMAAEALQPFEVTVKAAQANYVAGKELEVEVTARNTSKEVAKLKFNTGQKFDFSARKEGENELAWLWSADKIFAQALSTQEVKSDETISFKGTWPSPTAGQYTLTGIITANGRLKSAPITVTIK